MFNYAPLLSWVWGVGNVTGFDHFVSSLHHLLSCLVLQIVAL
jgi:hypothetical protein